MRHSRRYTPALHRSGEIGTIALAPFPDLGITVKGSGFQVIEQNDSLVRLKVIYNDTSNRFPPPGNYAYVSSQDKVKHWAKEVFTLDGEKFIICPEDRVVLFELVIE